MSLATNEGSAAVQAHVGGSNSIVTPPRWAVLISGNGSTLQTILEGGVWGGSAGAVKIVIASKDSAYGTRRALRAGVPVEVIPENLRGRAERDRAEEWILGRLAAHRVTHVFLAGYMRIVGPALIDAFRGRLYNIHPSLLPRYPGLDSLSRALTIGDVGAGVTVHHVVPEVDGGEVIAQRAFDFPPGRDSALSHLWLHIHEQHLLRCVLRRVGAGGLSS